MNRIFRIIWSTALGTWVVASELATRQGKRGGAGTPCNVADAEDRVRVSTHGPRALRLGVMAALFALYAPAHAQTTLYWDVNGTAPGTGGTGTWDLSTPYWNSASDGVSGPMVAWNNASVGTAVFTGTTGTVTLGAPITANALTFSGVSIETLTGSTLTLAGTTPTITLTASNVSIGSTLAGTAGLTVTGGGNLVLTGTNTFSGGIVLNAGSLNASTDAALGNSANGITMANGTVLIGGSAFSANRVITVTSGMASIQNGALSAQITGAGGVNATGTLSNNANNYTGQTRSGNLSFTSIADLGVASALGAPTTSAAGTVFIVSPTNTGNATAYYTGSGNQSNRNWELDSSANGQTWLQNNGTGTLTLTGNINAGGSGYMQNFTASTADLNLQGVISSSVSGKQFIYSGGAGRTITLAGANTYNGPSVINTVTVKASVLANTGSNSSFGTGTSGGISIINGVLSYTGGATSSNVPLSIQGAGTISNDGSGALSLTGATSFATGATNTLALGGSYTGTNTLSGVISGTGNIAMNGSGTWVLGGANTYTGTTTVQSGTLLAGSTQAFGTSTGLVVNGGTLDLNSLAITAPSLAGTGGSVNLGSGSLTLNATSGSTSYAGNITGSGSLTKSGASALTLSGANSYTGTTTVGGGTLTLDFTAAGAPASNIINSASTLHMSGGTLAVNGKASTSQSFNGLNVTAGSNKVVATAGSGGTLTLGLGAINQSGGVADFDYNSGATITTSNPDGSLGGWATVNGTDYAQVSGGVITALTNYALKDDASTWVNGDIVSDAGGAANTPYFNTVNGSVALGGLKYTAAANSTVTVGSGNTLGVGGNILVTSTVGSTSQTIQGGSLTGGPSGGPLGVLQNSAGTYTIASTIVDNGAPTSFTVGGSGTGSVVLTGANTYTGATTVSGGTLAFNSVANGGSASAIGAASNASSNLVLESGTLRYTGATASTDRGFTLQNGGPSRTIQVDNGANLTFSGLVTSPDSSGFNLTGTGTLTLANASNNFVGPITVNGGTLAATTLTNGGQASSIGAASNASSNLVLQNGGALAYTGGNASTDRGFTLGNGTAGNVGQVNVSLPGTTLTDSGTVVGSGALVAGGPGTLVLSGTNTYTGGTTVNGGTLRAGSSLAFGGSANGTGAGAMTVNSGATLDLAGNNVWVGGLNGAGSVTLGAGTLQINNSGTFSGGISGTGGVSLAGSGSQTFSGCGNTYTGPTKITGGNVFTDCLANGGVASGIGASNNAPSNLQIGSSGGLYYTGTSVSIDRGMTLSGGNGWVGVNNASTTLAFGGQVTGGGQLIKQGPGTLVLAGTANNYTGGTQVLQGILSAGATNAFGTATTAGALYVANTAGAILDMNGFDITAAGLNGGGTTGGEVRLSNNTLTLRDGLSLTYAGVISGSGNLVKNGTGVQALTGCNSTYTGTTTINAGALNTNCLANGGTASSIGASSNAPSNLVLNGGRLVYSGAATSTDRQFTLGGSAAIEASGTGALQFTNTAPITLTGTNTARTLTLQGTSTDNNSLSALIADNGTGQTSLTKAQTGTWILNNAASSYTGVTTIAGGVLGVSKLSNGGQASSIGSSSNAASNLIIGSGSTLLYTGSGDTTDRLFTLSTGVSYISSSGTGAVVFSNTGSASYTGSGNRTLALGGTNTGLNTMGGTIIDGPGGTTTLAKNEAGTWVLTGNNSYTGNTVINNGNLMIGNGGTTGNAGAGNVIVFAPTSTLSFNRSNTFNFTGTLSGPGTIAQIGTGTTVLTSASNSIGNTTVSAGTLQVNGGLTSGAVTVGAGTLQVQAGGTLTAPTIAMNTGSTLTVNGTVAAAGNTAVAFSGNTGPSTINVNSGGTLIGNGTLASGGGNVVNLSGTLNTGSGTLNLGTGNDTLVLNDGGTITGVVDGGSGGESGAGDTLQVNNTANRTLDGVSTTGFETLLKQGTGTLTLTGTQSYSAGTTVQAGTLLVDGIQSGTGGPVTVQSGATLGGTGTIAGNVTVASGGTLSPGDTGAVGTLTVNGNLTLNSGAALNYQFGQANTPGGSLNDLTTVSGNLTLGGTINVSTSSGGSFGPGVYRVFNYAGTLTNNGLSIGTAPAGTYYMQTSVANQVNLVNSTGLTLNFWDGAAGPKDNGVINGGNGTWQNASGNDNWADSTGQVNAPYSNGSFAVFEGTAGTVTVDNSLGNVTTSGMQFAVDGYTLTGNAIALTGAPNIIRVGDGTAAGANMTATINAALTGTGGVQKTDLGTLVLGGTNTYTGGTAIDGGTLQISSDANLGNASGGLTLDNGTLRNTAAFASSRAVTLNTNGGTFDTQANLTLSGTIGGTGALSKTSNGTLTLSGVNTYSGATTVQAGTLLVDGNQSAATGLTTVQSGATLGGNGTLGGNVVVASGGALNPGDTGAVGALTVKGNLTLNSGAALNYQFGQANTPGGALNDLTTVNGNLTLGGTLNVSTSPGGSFGPGVYRIFNYDGSLTDNGLVLGAVPAGNLYVQTSIAHQVNLVDSTGLTLNFWDGLGNESNSVVNGGTGTWRLANNDYWTDTSGTLNASYSNGAFAVFAGTPGTVTIDNTNGQVQASGLQFEVDGYHLAGGTLVLTGSTPTIRVGDGTAAGASMTATIDAQLAGTGTLVKDDLGTLVLTGNNTYAGGTTVQAGTLQVASDANLGDAAGALTLGDGTLHTTASFQAQRAVSLTGNGTFQTDEGTTLTLGNAISGSGSLTKTGGGSLVLGAASTYSGDTSVAAGTLQAAVANAFSASSAITVATNATLDLGGFAQNVASLANAGTVHFGSTPGTTLTVQGNYVGQGGTLNFNTVLGGDNSATDQLIVNGSTSGSSVVHVTNVGGTGAPTAQGIKLIDVQGASNGSFSLAGNYVFQGQQAVVAGAYAYRLYQGGTSTPNDGDWYLRSALLDAPTTTPLYQAGAPLYEAYAGVLRQINTLDSLYERVSDRTWASGASAADAMVPGDGVWMRVQGAGQTYKPEVTTTGADYDISTWKTEAGVDTKLGDTSGGALVAGAALQVGRYQSNVASVYGAGRIKTRSYGINATLTWYGDGGFYVDGQWRWTRLDSDLYSTTAAQVLKNGDKGSGYAVGVEAGQRFRLGDAWSLTPQVQVNYGRAAFNAFNDVYGANVSVQQGRDLVSRIGMALDYHSTWLGSRGPIDSHLYAIANLYRDLEGATDVDVSAADLISRNERLWGGLGIGGSLDWGRGRYSIYGQLQGRTGLSHFGDSHDVTGTLGFRVHW